MEASTRSRKSASRSRSRANASARSKPRRCASYATRRVRASCEPSSKARRAITCRKSTTSFVKNASDHTGGVFICHEIYSDLHFALVSAKFCASRSGTRIRMVTTSWRRMKTTQKIALIVLLALLGAVAYGFFRTGQPSSKTATKGATGLQTTLVDQSPVRIAQKLTHDADTPDEQALSKEAIRLADHEMDLGERLFVWGVRVEQ